MLRSWNCIVKAMRRRFMALSRGEIWSKLCFGKVTLDAPWRIDFRRDRAVWIKDQLGGYVNGAGERLTVAWI